MNPLTALRELAEPWCWSFPCPPPTVSAPYSRSSSPISSSIPGRCVGDGIQLVVVLGVDERRPVCVWFGRATRGSRPEHGRCKFQDAGGLKLFSGGTVPGLVWTGGGCPQACTITITRLLGIPRRYRCEVVDTSGTARQAGWLVSCRAAASSSRTNKRSLGL